MSRSRSRECKRRKRLAALGEALIKARAVDAEEAKASSPKPGHGAFWQALRNIERSRDCVWRVVQGIDCDEDERAMSAQVVACPLAAMSRVSARLRFARA